MKHRSPVKGGCVRNIEHATHCTQTGLVLVTNVSKSNESHWLFKPQSIKTKGITLEDNMMKAFSKYSKIKPVIQ